ncbi:MAG: hypothetical protein Q4E03_04915 [Trueperella sp.]|nr:hypothetical protein [Trueperella sp.]
MSQKEHTNEGGDNSERSSSNWRPANNNRGDYRKDRRQGQRRWSRDGDYSEKHTDRRADRRGGWRDDRRNDRGGRRWDGERRDDRRWNSERRDDRRGNWRDDRRDDRGGRRWDNDRRDNRRGSWHEDRRNDRSGRRWDNGQQDSRGKRRWDNDRRDDRRQDSHRHGGRWNDNRRNNGETNAAGYHSNERSWNRNENVTADLQQTDKLRLEIPDSITADTLDASARKRLRTLNKENAEQVARHLAYAGEMLDIDPEMAYQHAKAAYQRAARIDVVREALGIAAYLTERYAEALRELRTYRRMSNDYSHVAIEADSERGLGRSEKALQFIEGIPLNRLDPAAKIELALVTSGARAETGDSEGGLSVLEKIKIENLDNTLAARVQLIKADRLTELSRDEEAAELREKWEAIYNDGGEFNLVVDLDEVLDDLPTAAPSPAPETEDISTADAEDSPADTESEKIDDDADSAESLADLDDIEIADFADDFEDSPEVTGDENKADA